MFRISMIRKPVHAQATRAGPPFRPIAAGGSLAGIALAAVLSCAAPTPSPARTADAEALPTRDRVTGYQRFEVGGKSGYVKSIEGPGGERHEVYDRDMKPVGAYTSLGRTIRYRGADPPEHIGNYLPDDSLRKLFGIDSPDAPVVRMAMPAPLSLDDMEGEGAPAAEKPEAGAEGEGEGGGS